MFLAEAQQFLEIGAAIVFAACGFGRAELEIRVTQQGFQQRVEHLALTSEARAAIKALFFAGEMPDERIDEHVARASIEGQDLRWLGSRRKNGDVADAAEIQRHATKFFVSIKQPIGVRNER